jgi:WD40 repeat protein
VVTGRQSDRLRGGDGEGKDIVRVLNLSTGEDRELYHGRGKVGCTWAARQPKLLCLEPPKPEVFAIKLETGAIERIGTLAKTTVKALRVIRASRDGRVIYWWRADPTNYFTVQWDIATGQETVLSMSDADFNPPLIFRDERWLIRPNKQQIEARPVTGGDWKPVAAINAPGPDSHVATTPDGNWLLYHDTDSAGKQTLFRVPMTGNGPRERLGDFPTKPTCCLMDISPDGGKIIVNSYDYETGFELWALDNFIPATNKR